MRNETQTTGRGPTRWARFWDALRRSLGGMVW
jgi:hypothetical protein